MPHPSLSSTAIIFDLDDTLFFEADFVASARREIIRRLTERYPSLNPTALMASMADAPIHGPGAFDLLHQALPEDVRREATVEWMRRVYRSHTPDITLRPEVRATLQSLVERGATLGIITDGRVETQTLKIHALGLTEFISPRLISVSEALGADKYHPEPFTRMEALTPDARHRIYIGDNAEKDFLHPRALGWTAIMVSDPTNPRTIFRRPLDTFPEPYRPHHAVGRLEDILAICDSSGV